MGGGPVKLELGMESGFGNPLGKNGILTWVIFLLWWVMGGGCRINGVGMNC